MPDLYVVQALLAFGYGAAGAGTVLGLLARAFLRRDRRRLSSGQAALCAFFPLFALGALTLAAGLPFLFPAPGHLFHEEWHNWMAGVRRVLWLHGVLHAANALLLLLAIACAGRAVFAASRIRALLRALRELDYDPFPWGNLTVRRFASTGIHCFTVGALRPQVYVSAGLLERVSARDAEAMLAHEAAHVRRRDGLLKTVLTLFYLVFPLSGGAALCREWESACERACDAEAARQLGSACDVASALITAARLMHTAPSPAACFAACSAEDMEDRVRALLDRDQESQGGRRESPWLAALLGMFCLTAFILTHPYLAHAVELFVHHC